MIGYCSFDLIRYQNKILKSIEVSSEYPDASFNLVESVYVFDHFKKDLFVITSNLFSNRNEQALNQELDNMIEELQNIKLFENKINHHKKVI